MYEGLASGFHVSNHTIGGTPAPASLATGTYYILDVGVLCMRIALPSGLSVGSTLELSSLRQAEGTLGPRWSALALQALATYKALPPLRPLVPLLAAQAAAAAPEMRNAQVALCVWAVAEMKELSRQLQVGLRLRFGA